MPAGYLLVSAFHKQAFASATQHQLLAFLQVAAFTNRTAVLPFARFGEPAFVGLPEAGFHDLERYFDVADLAKRWPCLRVLTYREFRAEHGKPPVALQLGTPRTAAGDVVPSGCGKRSRPLMALKATFACASLALLASARRALGGDRWRTDAVVVTNWSQKVVGLGDASSPLFGDAFAARGGCHDAAAARDARAWPKLADRWERAADAFLRSGALPAAYACAHVRAEKLASAATGREKRSQWAATGDEAEPFASPYMENCVAGAAALASRGGGGLLLLTDTSAAHGTPSNQGSEHFREWRSRGERLLRAALPRSAGYCGAPGAVPGPDCAAVEAALCRRATHVWRFGSGTFSAFLVGDAADAPPSTRFLSCPDIAAAAGQLE